MKKINKELFNECKRCGYKWYSRKPNPKSCPSCKTYKYMIGLNDNTISKAIKNKNGNYSFNDEKLMEEEQ